ncbi:MAG: UDP-glucuronate 4-epimerase [Phycisphaerales bacterium]
MGDEEQVMASRTIVVTGAAGFIGSHVAEALVRRGERVIGIDNFDPFYGRDLKAANAAAVAQAASESEGSFELIEADLCDAVAIAPAFERGGEGADGVIHLAAKAGVRPSIADPAGYARANVLGTQVVLSAASKAGLGWAVCASSSSVYGNNTKVPFAESDSVEHPISPYAATKRSCELIGETHHHLTGLPIAMLRFFTVFGPRQRPDLAIGLFLGKVAAGEPIRMFGDGSTSRDYTFIDDIVSGILASTQNIGAHGFRVWNLGGESPASLKDMIGAVGRVVGREPIVNQEGLQPGDVDRTWADLQRAKAELGFAPTTGLEDGMRQQWAWMQSQGSGIRDRASGSLPGR